MVHLWVEFDIVEKNTCLDHTDITSHDERLDNVDAIWITKILHQCHLSHFYILKKKQTYTWEGIWIYKKYLELHGAFLYIKALFYYVQQAPIDII